MTIQTINTGSSANAGNGDTLRSAFSKINSNFTYINSSLTNLILSGGLVGPTGPQGDPGPQGEPGMGSGTITSGQIGRFAIYVSNSTTIASTDALSLDTSTNTVQIGNFINTNTNFIVRRNAHTSIPGQGWSFTQHHEEADAVNLVFLRSRGSHVNQLPLRAGDEIGEIFFTSTSNNGSSVVGLASITVLVDNTATTWETGKIIFSVNSGQSLSPSHFAELNSSGTWKVDSLDSLTTGSSLTVKNNLIPSENLTYDLGSTSSQWRSLYVGTTTIYLGGTALSVVDGALSVDGTTISPGASFDQDLNTDNSPNFVNMQLAGTTGSGFATLAIQTDRNFVIGMNDSSLGPTEFEFNRDGMLTVPGEVYGKFFSLRGGNLSGTIGAVGYGGDRVEISGLQGVGIIGGVDEISPVWNFGTDGDLTVPNYIQFKDGSFIGDEGGASPPVFRIDAPLGFGINFTTDSDITGTNNVWALGIDGSLTFPDGTTQTTAYNFIDTIPASSTSTGVKGQLAVDSTSLYVCIATNSWLKFNGITF